MQPLVRLQRLRRAPPASAAAQSLTDCGMLLLQAGEAMCSLTEASIPAVTASVSCNLQQVRQLSCVCHARGWKFEEVCPCWGCCGGLILHIKGLAAVPACFTALQVPVQKAEGGGAAYMCTNALYFLANLPPCESWLQRPGPGPCAESVFPALRLLLVHWLVCCLAPHSAHPAIKSACRRLAAPLQTSSLKLCASWSSTKRLRWICLMAPPPATQVRHLLRQLCLPGQGSLVWTHPRQLDMSSMRRLFLSDTHGFIHWLQAS
jgi:hypothetical protein